MTDILTIWAEPSPMSPRDVSINLFVMQPPKKKQSERDDFRQTRLPWEGWLYFNLFYAWRCAICFRSKFEIRRNHRNSFAVLRGKKTVGSQSNSREWCYMGYMWIVKITKKRCSSLMVPFILNVIEFLDFGFIHFFADIFIEKAEVIARFKQFPKRQLRIYY